MAQVHISFLLKPAQRTAAARGRVQEIAEGMGLRFTSGGAASLSFVAEAEQVERLLGVAVRRVPRRAPGRRDAGAPAGFEVPEAIPIPAPLAPYVDVIGIAPPATRMND
ncbi:MAG: hypothetical protein AB7Q17_03790 [Phycisphaerae bacterium]